MKHEENNVSNMAFKNVKQPAEQIKKCGSLSIKTNCWFNYIIKRIKRHDMQPKHLHIFNRIDSYWMRSGFTHGVDII